MQFVDLKDLAGSIRIGRPADRDFPDVALCVFRLESEGVVRISRSQPSQSIHARGKARLKVGVRAPGGVDGGPLMVQEFTRGKMDRPELRVNLLLRPKEIVRFDGELGGSPRRFQRGFAGGHRRKHMLRLHSGRVGFFEEGLLLWSDQCPPREKT